MDLHINSCTKVFRHLSSAKGFNNSTRNVVIKRSMTLKIIIISFATIMSLTSCEKVFMKPNPQTDNISIFEEFYKVIDEKYAMLEFKGVNWKNEYQTYRDKVNNEITDDSLFSVLGEMILKLRDAHTLLEDYENNRYAIYDNESGFLKNLDQEIIDKYYLNENVQTQGDGFRYKILDDNVGFIEYRDFDMKVKDKMMNDLLNDLKDTKGIILDVRGNGGGDPYYAYLMASHFADKETYVGFERFKTGPKADDFTDSKIYLSPSDGTNYTKPVMVLTNRQCFSATTTLIYYLNPFSHITFVGALTGGGSGSVFENVLANGWNYSLSSSEFIDWEGSHLDDGFEPDITVELDISVRTKDEIIDRAIFEILK